MHIFPGISSVVSYIALYFILNCGLANAKISTSVMGNERLQISVSAQSFIGRVLVGTLLVG